MKLVFRLLIGSVLGLVIAFYGIPRTPEKLTRVYAAVIPGTATVSGVVEAPKPFMAAQVYFRNPDKRMLYMVYTSGGHYQAMQLFAGTYEVSVKAKGLNSEIAKLTLKAGQNATMNLSMHESTTSELKKGIEYLKFSEIYPDGPGKAVAQRTCVYCHGANFLPSKQFSEKQWNDALDYMAGNGKSQGVMIQPDELNAQDRKDLLQYLATNFGPSSKLRAVKVETDMPVEEASVSKAEYIEYYFPVDPPGQGVNDPKYKSADGGEGFASGRRMGQDPQLDQQGNVWVTDRGFPNRLVKLDPRIGEYREWLMPDPLARAHDLDIDKFGTIWIPENEGIPAGQPKLRAFDPKTEKFTSSYLFDPEHVVSTEIVIHPQSLAFDSNGNIYVGFIRGNALAKWDRETKKMSTFIVPTPNSSPYGVVVDKNDNVWIAEFHGSKIAKFDPKTSKFTEYSPATHPALIRRLVVGSDGFTIWSGLFSAGKLIKLDQATGKITEYKIPHEVSQPYDFVPQGKYVWFSDAGQGGALIRFDPETEKFTYFPGPQRADMPKIRLTKDGAIWYSPRSSREYPGLGVLYPDITKVTRLTGTPAPPPF